jgi:hypothetical protein
VAREFASHQLFCARIAGASLMRRTGWVYAKANRVPARRPGSAGLLRADPAAAEADAVRRPAAKAGAAGRPAGARSRPRTRPAAGRAAAHPPDASFGCPLSMSARRGSRLECGMPERVITLAISDADWKALRAVQPSPSIG